MNYNKLIRDRIPEIIRKNGENAKVHIADEKEYWKKLKEKLIEEAEEFNKNSTKEEFADVLEVVRAIGKVKGFRRDEIEDIRKKKLDERGAFDNKIILESTD